jgi:hypothetical protein
VCFRENSWRQLARQSVLTATLPSHSLLHTGNMCTNICIPMSANSVRNASEQIEWKFCTLVQKIYSSVKCARSNSPHCWACHSIKQYMVCHSSIAMNVAGAFTTVWVRLQCMLLYTENFVAKIGRNYVNTYMYKDVAVCCLVDHHWHFGEICHHLQGLYMPEDSNICSYCLENFKYYLHM